MKQIDSDKYDQGLKSLGNRINITQEEQNQMIDKINTKIENDWQTKRRTPINWSYYFVLIATLLVISILTLPVLNNVPGESMEITAKERVEKFFEAYTTKDFDAYYDMLSTLEKEKLEKVEIYSDSSENNKVTSLKRDREEIITVFEKAWKPVEVIKIEEKSGGTEQGTIVSATLHYPARGSDPEHTIIETYKLIKENGEWKIAKFISKEIIE
ncbi:nuclear transport factor 2 family protein [Cytobacillus massiliigabonensis]|uniref:hypothetical protein n=1 Tax=Cytobacillus massiliigabonensis TaxID=1871011 RepID=UPI000C823BBA|nr:hypothetical protein [Cytobacillus massiliigabonensis]